MGADRRKAFFSISAVAKMFSVHQQTIRLYEREGLLNPKRSSGNTRMFSEEDIDRLDQIIHLTQQLGVNLAGVEQILKLQKQVQKLQNDMNKLFEKTQHQLGQELEHKKANARGKAQSLALLKQNSTKSSSPKAANHQSTKTVDIDNWEVEYEES